MRFTVIVKRNSQNSSGNLEYLSEEDREKIIIHWGDITDNLFIDMVEKDLKRVVNE